MPKTPIHDGSPPELTIETLTSPPVKIDPAPLHARFMAALIDSALLTIAWLTIERWNFTLALERGFASLADLTTLTLFALAYFILLEGLLGGTVGKLIFRIRVVNEVGDSCSWRASFIRNLLRLVDWLPLFYIVGGVTLLISPKRQRIGDMLAKTVVTKAAKKDINPPPAPFLFH